MNDNASHAGAEPLFALRRGFQCGLQAGWSECWCATLPAVSSLPDKAAGCYCPDCLKSLLGVASAATSGESSRD
ncbi:cysteine-rich CWC family protein [Aromatoleum sp.]|uniref:cysteine-rich CWC family protein n=1 Tax=Aromatoleum sp. TaxID=2307007 RepID=UPI002FCBEF62